MFLSLISCKNSEHPEESKINNEIQSLDSNEQKTAYLENIYKQDQNDRNGNVSSSVMYTNDLARLARVKAYINAYGYPKRKVLGGPSADVIYLVFHHIATNETKREYFPIFYRAMLDKEISKETLAFFLGRYQNDVNGAWIDFDRPFTTEEEIDTLVFALGLESIATSIKNNHNAGL